jgi:deoxyadenosine/deoxycytidine kinase
MIPYQYIAIEGNIGSGKSTLTGMFAEEMNCLAIYEQFEENSFLPKFYENPERYAFPLELSFLAERHQQLKPLSYASDLFYDFILADYFLSKSLIFARQTLKGDEFKLFQNLFSIIKSTLRRPDLIVYLYLNTDQLLKNIARRGRSYEQHITADYLDKIQHSYLSFLEQQTDSRIVLIDMNRLDFVTHREDYQKLKNLIFKNDYPLGITRITP